MDNPFDLPPDVLRRIPLFAEIAKVLSWRGGPVNWDLAREVATSIAAGEGGGARVTEADNADVEEHVRIAELWVEELAGLPPARSVHVARAATPADLAQHATIAFSELIDPVAAKAARALSVEGGEGIENMMAQALGQTAPMFMAMQAGSVLGNLARDVTGTHEVGLPVGEDALLLVLATIDQIARDYMLESRDVRQWVAVRAVAARSLTEAFPGARANFFAMYHDFVSSLDIDLGEAMSKLQELDLSDPARLQDAFRDEGLFNPQPSAATAAATERVARFIALTDAHVGVASEAAAPRIGAAARIAEAFARRSAGDTKGTSRLYAFIGLEPPDAGTRRDAAAFVRAVSEQAGSDGLSRMWEDTENFPRAEELQDPQAWLRRTTE